MVAKRTFLAGILILGAATLGVYAWASRGHGATRAGARDAAVTTGSRLVVHEWGTFTSFAGSDSVKLEFRPLEQADLPEFVLNRGKQSGVPNPLTKLDYRVLQRMETPVTYFYTDEPRQVNVRVGFPQGLLTEFYPPVEKMEPAFEWFKEVPVGNSSLDWGKVWLIPENRFQVGIEPAEVATKLHTRLMRRVLPLAVEKEHYAYARETDSAVVYVERQADKALPLLPRGAFFEKFLFYRGIGNFELPLKLTAEGKGGFELKNVGAEAIRSLFLVTVQGEQLRFVKYAEARPGATLKLQQSATAATPEQLGEAVVDALIDEQLYEKEARAMVKTWQSSWFGEQGTRLFYILPEPVTNRLLPLTIEPKPDETVRVMVGRLEIMTPEDEVRISNVVIKSIVDRAAAANRAEQYALPAEIVALGRLAEPALVRVKNISTSSTISGEVDQLLKELPRQQN